LTAQEFVHLFLGFTAKRTLQYVFLIVH